MDESELIKGMEKFIEDLESGKPIEVTDVTREETPDGPLHTFTKKFVTLDELRDGEQGGDSSV